MSLDRFLKDYEMPATPGSSPELLFYAAFQRIFGVPRGLLSKSFQAAVRVVLDSRPRWRCSASHAIWEGMMEGIPVPYGPLKVHQKQIIGATLFCLDVLDTMVGMHLEAKLNIEDNELLNRLRHAMGPLTQPKVNAATRTKPVQKTRPKTSGA